VVAALAPVLISAVVMVVIFSRQEQAAVEHGMRGTARALVVAIDRELESSVTALEALATLKSLDTGNLAEFYDQAARVAASRRQSISLAGLDGSQLLSTLVPFGSALPPLGEREYFRRVIRSGGTSIADLLIGDAASDDVIAVPVRRDGKLLYVLIAGTPPSIAAAKPPLGTRDDRPAEPALERR
jgi:hypothetical protein